MTVFLCSMAAFPFKMEADCFIPLEKIFKISEETAFVTPKKCENCPFEAICNLLFLRHICVQTPKGHSRFMLQNGLFKRFVFEEGLFQCRCCGYRTGVKGSMRNHIIAKHLDEREKRENWYNCDHCDFCCPTKFVLKLHIFRKHTDKENMDWIKCPDCKYKTKVRGNFELHTKRKHSGKTNHSTQKVSCTICNKLVVSVYLQLHIEKMHRDQSSGYNCDVCEQTFKWKLSLQNHINRKHTSPKYKQWATCPHCDYKNVDKQELKFHIIAKHKPEEGTWHQCTFCEFKTLRDRSLKIHVMRKHIKNEDSSWFKCTFCKYKTKANSQLMAHIESDHFVNTETCELCQRTFTTKSSLKQHKQRKHPATDTPNALQCTVCDYKTPSEQHLRTHVLKKHSGKLHQCSFCQFKTVYASVIKRHVLSKHTKDEDVAWFNCGFCAFKSKVNSVLRRHIQNKHNTHIKTWHSCEECEAKFTVKGELESHVFLHHRPAQRDRIVKCDFCEFAHLHKSTVDRHMSTKHKGQVKSEVIIEKDSPVLETCMLDGIKEEIDTAI